MIYPQYAPYNLYNSLNDIEGVAGEGRAVSPSGEAYVYDRVTGFKNFTDYINRIGEAKLQNNNLGITGTEQFQDFYYDPNKYYADFPGYQNLPEQKISSGNRNGIRGTEQFQDFYYDPNKYYADFPGYQNLPEQKISSGNRNGIRGLLQAAMGYITKSPIGLIGSLFGGIGSLNNRLQNSDFGRSATLAEFFQRRRDRKAREEAAIRGAQKEIQRNISQGTSGDIGGGWTQRDTGGGTVSFSGPSGESFSGYSNTQEGIGAASADWGSS